MKKIMELTFCIILAISTVSFIYITLICHLRPSGLSITSWQKIQFTTVVHFILLYQYGQGMYDRIIQQIKWINHNQPDNWNVKIFIIQQNENQKFQRSLLLDIGILQSLNNGKADCLVVLDSHTEIEHSLEYIWCDNSTRMNVCIQLYGSTYNQHSMIATHIDSKSWMQINLRSLLENKRDGVLRIFSYIGEFNSKWTNVEIPYLSKKVFDILKRPYSSPIVLPLYKLIFIWNAKAACSYWKLIFQYIQGIRLNYTSTKQIHHPKENGLLTLRKFSDININRMIYDPTWMKVIFVREARERLLSAYLDKVRHTNYFKITCGQSVNSFEEFINIISECPDMHWDPQVNLPETFYKNMTIGRMDNISQFTEDLLKKIGAWNSTVQQWITSNGDIVRSQGHATNSSNVLSRYYNTELENKIFERYELDYKVFTFNKTYFSLQPQ